MAQVNSPIIQSNWMVCYKKKGSSTSSFSAWAAVYAWHVSHVRWWNNSTHFACFDSEKTKPPTAPCFREMWWFLNLGIPPNHPFYRMFNLQPSILGSPILRNPHVLGDVSRSMPPSWNFHSEPSRVSSVPVPSACRGSCLTHGAIS